MKLPHLPAEPPAYKPTIRFAVAIGGILIPLWAIFGFISNSSESYVVTNGAVALLLASSGICFSFARALNHQTLSDRILFAGERLFHGSLLIALSTAMRYLIFKVAPSPDGPFGGSILIGVSMAIPFLLVVWVFGTGALIAGTGVRVIMDVLNDRMFRHRDWDDIV